MKSGLWQHMQHKKLETGKAEERVIERVIFLKMLYPSYPLSHAHLEYSFSFQCPQLISLRNVISIVLWDKA